MDKLNSNILTIANLKDDEIIYIDGPIIKTKKINFYESYFYNTKNEESICNCMEKIVKDLVFMKNDFLSDENNKMIKIKKKILFEYSQLLINNLIKKIFLYKINSKKIYGFFLELKIKEFSDILKTILTKEEYLLIENLLLKL